MPQVHLVYFVIEIKMLLLKIILLIGTPIVIFAERFRGRGTARHKVIMSLLYALTAEALLFVAFRDLPVGISEGWQALIVAGAFLIIRVVDYAITYSVR